MSKLTIVANIHALPEKAEWVGAQLHKLVARTRNETGCIQYDLHRNNTDVAHFLFFEKWESRELWQTHMKAQHVGEFSKATEGCVEKFTLHEMSELA